MARHTTSGRTRPAAGMTTIELLVAIGVLGIVMGLAVQLILHAIRMSDHLAARAALQEDVSAFVERLSRDVGGADHVRTVGNRLVIFQRDDRLIEYTYVPPRQTILRDTGKAKPCLRESTQIQEAEFVARAPILQVSIGASRRMPRSQQHARFSLSTVLRIPG